MPRFALLYHELPPTSERKSHWDLLLEPAAEAEPSAVGLLRAWALETPLDGPQPIRAARLADHRRLYLDYEGPISGDRGEVRRVAEGDYQLLQDSPTATILHLSGKKLSGRLTITHLEPPAALLTWEAD